MDCISSFVADGIEKVRLPTFVESSLAGTGARTGKRERRTDYAPFPCHIPTL